MDSEWLVCPNCRTRLHRVCPSCNRLAEPNWPLCAFCGKDFERGAPRVAARPGTAASTATSHESSETVIEEASTATADATAERARLRGATNT